MKNLLILALAMILAACGAAPASTSPAPASTPFSVQFDAGNLTGATLLTVGTDTLPSGVTATPDVSYLEHPKMAFISLDAAIDGVQVSVSYELSTGLCQVSYAGQSKSNSADSCDTTISGNGWTLYAGNNGTTWQIAVSRP